MYHNFYDQKLRRWFSFYELLLILAIKIGQHQIYSFKSIIKSNIEHPLVEVQAIFSHSDRVTLH